jgi:hypothetical protein
MNGGIVARERRGSGPLRPIVRSRELRRSRGSESREPASSLGAQPALFAKSAGFTDGGPRCRRTIIQRAQGAPGWRRVQQPEDRIALQCFVQRGPVEQVRSSAPRPGKPATHYGRGCGCCRDLGIHETPVAAGAAIRRKSQETIQRLFEYAVGVSFPDRAALALGTFVKSGLIPIAESHQLTPVDTQTRGPDSGHAAARKQRLE